jgi:hypothetical protein
MANRLLAGCASACLLFILVFPAVAVAQVDTATVIGTIADSQGGVLPGATITAKNVDTGFLRSGVTDAEGRYRLAAIPPGRYELTAELSGFATSIRRGVTLTLGGESVINFELSVAALAEAVSVIAESPVVETTTAAVQSTMNREQIDLLPLIGRNFESLLRLTPGAVANNASYSFTGSRGRSNQWSIDGVDNSEDISGYSRQSPALDSIQEVQVIVNGFRAEFGNASGGIINVVTRSGTNSTHGSGLYLYRNQDLMSRSPYADRALPADPFQRIHYGGTIGGPLVRDRMHYFATYEREDRDTFTSSTRTLPSRNASWSTATLQFLRSNGIDLSAFPDIPAAETLRLRQTRPEFVDVHKATARVDRQLNRDQSLTVRYTMDHERDPSGSSGSLFDFNASTALFRTNYATVNHKWILGGDRLNEAYLQIGQSFGDWYVHSPNLINVTITGGPSIGGPSNYPQGRTDYVFQFNDSFTWNRTGARTGEHVLKMGTQIKLFRSDSFFDSNYRGTYTFPSLTAFINGTPSIFTQNRGDSRLARPNDILGFYVQDDWRPTPSLTLNLGLRYDFEGAKTEALRDVNPNGEPGAGISGDKNNFAPRVGIAWSPGGSTKQAFYGGTGIYYDQVILNVIGNARFTPPKVIGVRIDNPFWPDPYLGGTVSTPLSSVSIIDESLRTPYNWNSQVGYRRELAKDLGLDVSFVYNRGYDHVFIVNTNAGRPGSASFTGGNPVRPDPNWINKSFYTNIGEIRYKGLLVDLRKRFSGNFQGGLSYTLGKTMDNSFNFVSGVQVPERPDLNWGPGGTDRRHVVEGHVEYRLPWDVQLGAIVEYRTEAPLDITAGGRDLNGDGITGDWVNEQICRGGRAGAPASFANGCPGFTYSRNSVRELTLDQANALRTLFGLAPIASFNNNPKYFNADLTLQKRIRVSGSYSVRVTAEAFNVFNIPQRNQPGQDIFDTGNFGQYSSVDQPRAIQFTVQVDF